MERVNHRPKNACIQAASYIYLQKANQTDSTVLYLEVETARVPRDRIHATVASSRREDAGQRKKEVRNGRQRQEG